MVKKAEGKGSPISKLLIIFLLIGVATCESWLLFSAAADARQVAAPEVSSAVLKGLWGVY